MTPLLGLGGKLRAGKDEVANHLVERHGYVKLGMSDALLEAALVLDPIVDWDDFYSGEPVRLSERVRRVGYVEAKKNPEVRRFLQVLGTEFGRNMIDENIWVDIMRRKIRGWLDSGFSVVVTGIRYPNELDMIRRLGGEAWWIDRSAATGSTHASENSVSPFEFDRIVFNNGTLDDLYRKVDAA